LATKKHLGFDKVSNSIAQGYIDKGMSPKKAQEIGDATAAKVARNASPAAKKANPKLKNVKGSMDKSKMCAADTKVKCACKTKASASSPMKAACKGKK
jgi:hypothetical protein